MKVSRWISVVSLCLLTPGVSWAQGQAPLHAQVPIPRHEVTVLVDLDPVSANPEVPKIEGITADRQGNLYTVDSASGNVVRVNPLDPVVEVVGTIPACVDSCFGVTFNEAGDLFISASRIAPGRVLRIAAADLASGFGTITDPAAITYASGVSGVNGLAFDENGFLFAGGSGMGRVYLVPPGGGSFSIFNASDLIPLFCRCTDNPALTCPLSGPSPAGCNPQRTVSNGVAITRRGDVVVADTARGALWKIHVLRDGAGTPSFGGMSLLVQDPLLEGADGITADVGGNFWIFANERNAIVHVTPSGRTHEVAQNDSHGPLEFPTNGVIVDGTLYISNFDNPRRDNTPNTNGIGASIVQMFIGIPGVK